MEELWRTETIFGDRVHRCRLGCGTTLLCVQKPGFVRTHAAFTAKYGSFDNSFRLPGRPPRETPDGIAHFLEHKLFESREGNALEMFSRRGALINAGTSYRFTTYYFTAVTDFEAQLRLLVDFVRTPHFTRENVAKEQGIIAQEIRMYDDMPDDVRTRMLLGALFGSHPIRTHIAGTTDSIACITPELLYECFDAFYRPENMILCAVGDFDRAAVRAGAEEALASKPEWCAGRGAPSPIIPPEAPAAACAYASRRMPVGYPKIAIGYKETGSDALGPALLARENVADFLVEMLFGRASTTFKRLYDEGLVDESFFAYGGIYPRVGYVAVGADTPHPERCIAALGEAAARAADLLTEEDFVRVRRKFEGEFIRRFNSVELLASMCLGSELNESTMSEAWAALDCVTLADVREYARALFTPERRAVAAVLPLEWVGEPGP